MNNSNNNIAYDDRFKCWLDKYFGFSFADFCKLRPKVKKSIIKDYKERRFETVKAINAEK